MKNSNVVAEYKAAPGVTVRRRRIERHEVPAEVIAAAVAEAKEEKAGVLDVTAKEILFGLPKRKEVFFARMLITVCVAIPAYVFGRRDEQVSSKLGYKSVFTEVFKTIGEGAVEGYKQAK